MNLKNIIQNITEKELNSISQKYEAFIASKPFITGDFKRDLLYPPGKQHYRLLAYLSSLFHHQTIIEIGTYTGLSALALAFNPTNHIHTFDILDVIIPEIKTTTSNISTQIENLMEPDVRAKWKETILACPFIFIDIDPHNGHMEYELYEYFKSIKYKGFIVFDDIWYFKTMRDNFWYKIPPTEKFELTNVGHFSGTGIIPGYVDDEEEVSTQTVLSPSTICVDTSPKWTLVTAYFNLTKCPDASDAIRARGFEYYMEHATSTLCLPYPLVIYCDKESYEFIKAIRPIFFNNITQYIICEFDDCCFVGEKIDGMGRSGGRKIKSGGKTFREYRKIIQENRRQKPYSRDPRNTESYYLFCMMRYIMLKRTIEQNPFQSTHFAWINICIERMGWQNVSRLEEALNVKRDRFSTCYIDYVSHDVVKDNPEYWKWGRCTMCSGFFTGNAEYMYKVCDLIENKFLEYLDLGYGHTDEQLYSPVYFEHPELFEHYYGDYHQMITNYKWIYDAPHAPIYNFIRNSYYAGEYKKCYEACQVVFKSLCMKKCEINDEGLLRDLYFCYMQCKRIVGDF